MDGAVDPVLHEKVPVPDAFSVTESPLQIAVLPAGVIVAAGSGFTVTACVAVDVPQVLVAVTVYVPAEEAVIAVVVAPVLHE